MAAAAVVVCPVLLMGPQEVTQTSTGAAPCISDFPLDVWHGLLLRYLAPRDVCVLSGVSRKLRQLCEDDLRVWMSICRQAYGHATIVDNWVGPTGVPTYRQLFPVLNTYASYVGVWHKAPSGIHSGSLYSFRWASNGIEVVQLVPCQPYLTEIAQEKLCTLGPSYPRYQADLVDGTKCVLRDYGRDHAAAQSAWSTAEAAARVAAGGAGVLADAPLASSPGSTGFAYELLRFMQSSVQKTRSGRKNRRSGGSSTAQPVLHHFCRVPSPLKPASKHPHQLQGLWKGLYGPHGCELLAVSYDFTERSARIVATKLTGDPNVPAGEVTWQVSTAKLPVPLSAQEQQLIDLRPQLVAQAAATARRVAEHEAADEAAGNVIAALLQQEEPPQHAMQLLAEQQQQPDNSNLVHDQQFMQQQQQQEVDVTLVPELGGMTESQRQQKHAMDKLDAWESALLSRRVVSVYKGKGRMAGHGFQNPSWVDGRLWMYSDGSCGFVYIVLQEPHLVCHLIDLQRLDDDL